MRIHNLTKGTTTATKARLARSHMARLIGLLNRSSLDLGEALVLSPCKSVHTCFMRFPIDVVSLDASGEVIGLMEDMRPFRFSPLWRHAKAIVELPVGTIKANKIEPRDRLELIAD